MRCDEPNYWVMSSGPVSTNEVCYHHLSDRGSRAIKHFRYTAPLTVAPLAADAKKKHAAFQGARKKPCIDLEIYDPGVPQNGNSHTTKNRTGAANLSTSLYIHGLR